MAISYGALKCTECAGKKFDYIKEEKAWKCLYCGALNRRAEDPIVFSLKNNVRQVILDVAYRRLDSAEQNLVQCKKIDSRHVGTIIAEITYQMIKAITPGACPQAELRSLFSQLKRNYEELQAIDKKVSGDEEALYEFFESADVYATLVLVYDSLNDTMRRDYVAGLLNASEIYAKEPNKNMLSYALKVEKYDLVDEIMSNPDNTEPGFALTEILQKYPDSENKIKNVEGVLKAHALKDDDKKIFENYLVDSSDTLPTKGQIIILAYSASVKVSLEAVIGNLLYKADGDIVDAVLRQVCSTKLNDEDVYKIVEFSSTVKEPSITIVILNVLKETNQYVLMTSKYIIALLSRVNLSATDKSAIVRKMLEFNIDAKSKDAIINNYLCFNQDPAEVRLVIIPILLSLVSVIQTNTIESYVLTINVDGKSKPDIVEKIFALDLNMSFFHDLLAKYMGSSIDEKEVKDKVVATLVGKGLKVDPKSLIDHICNASISAEDKVAFVKKMLSGGMQLRSDTVNIYLESITPERFNSELFALIAGSASNISERALSNYLLICKDRDTLKPNTFIALAKQCYKNTIEIYCEAMCANQKIYGNILPIYLLATPDSFETTKSIADYLIGYKAKINVDIQTGTGKTKLKKFVSAYGNALSPVSSQICTVYKVK